MKCLICGSMVVGIYCVCGEKMKIETFKFSGFELKNNDVEKMADPEYMRHFDEKGKENHKKWIAESLKTTVHLPKEEKSKFWIKNMKLALAGQALC